MNNNETNMKSLIKGIEELNLDNLKYKRTKNYINENKRFISKKILKEKGFLNYLYFQFKMKIILNENKKEAKVNDEYNYSMLQNKKVAVYTAIIGEYDEIMEPIYIPENCKYILFTNNKNIKSDKWEIRDIPKKIKEFKSNTLINRYIKMHPKELLEDYDYSIYIDGNVKTVSDVTEIIEMVNNNTGLAIHRHSIRNCIYEEMKICILLHKGKVKKLIEQIKKYKKDGFPKKYGLLECNVIVTDLHNMDSFKILNEWWKEFIRTESNRDQIALPYVLWKNGLKIEDIGNLGNNIYLNRKFIVGGHKWK